MCECLVIGQLAVSLEPFENALVLGLGVHGVTRWLLRKIVKRLAVGLLGLF